MPAPLHSPVGDRRCFTGPPLGLHRVVDDASRPADQLRHFDVRDWWDDAGDDHDLGVLTTDVDDGGGVGR